MESQLVSVIIPNYNYAEFVEQAIISVLNQDYHSIELIVVDDGSVDDSRNVIGKYGHLIKVVEINNSGAPTARNFGLMHAMGQYIAYLDSDDYWLPSKISSQINRLQQTGNELVYCMMEVIEPNSQASGFTTEKREGTFRDEFLLNPGRTPFPPSTVLMTRGLVAKVGLWDTAFKSPAEDFDYFRRCAKYTEFSVVDSPLVVHRNHSKSLTAQSIEKYYADNCLSIIKLFADEYPKLDFLDRRKCWIKLNLAFGKSFLLSRKPISALRCLLKCILPISP
jgi:teichuronic acid biosynthesis glycosyltransferase TuaG